MKYVFRMFLIIGILFSASRCGTSSSSSSSNIPTLSLKCGSAACVKQITGGHMKVYDFKFALLFLTVLSCENLMATAAGQAPFTFTRSIRNSIGFVMGYADGTASGDFYAQTNCATEDPAPGLTSDCTDAPPRSGLVDTAADIMSELQTMLNGAGITSCSAIPASGTASLTMSSGTSVTATFFTPTHSVPAAWSNGGTAYTKGVKLSMTIANSTTLMAAEFACGTASAFVRLNMQVGSHAPGYYRYINIVSGEKSGGIKTAEVFISEVNPTNSRVRGAYALSLDINESNTTYKIKGTVSVNDGSVGGMDYINLHGNYTTQNVSSFFKRYVLTNNSYINGSTLAAMSGATSAAVGTSANYNFTDDWCNVQSYSGGYPNCDSTIAAQTAGTIVTKQGCIDVANPTTAPTSNAYCTGLTPSDPDAPVIDSSGAFSPAWAINTMHTKIDVTGIENP